MVSSIRRKLESLFWSPPPEDPAERKLVRKLDAVILTYVILNLLVNFLDRANLANAYVSGMKEDVGFQGNDYTYANSCFTAGYVIGQWPSAFILSSGRIPPRIWLPFCAVAWGLLTLGLAFVTTPHQVWGLRLVQGIFEASSFSGGHYIVGSWFKDSELGKRSALIGATGQFGSLFSGVMQGAIVTNLQNKNGLKGWQWLFIIDFIITIPVAAYGYLMFPDMPHNTKAKWLTAEEKEIAIARMPKTNHELMTMTTFLHSIRRIVLDWRWYAFSLLFAISATSFEKTGVYSEFALWLKAQGTYTVPQINYYPLIFISTAIVTTYFLAIFSDHYKNRFIVNPIMFVCVAISSGMLLHWDMSTGAHWFAYIIAGPGYAGQATNFAWANTSCRDDEVLRAVTLASMNLLSNIWAIWYGIVCWPVVDAPRFRNGQIATLVTGAVSVGIAVVIMLLLRRKEKAAAAASGIDSYDGASDQEAGKIDMSAEGDKEVVHATTLPIANQA